MAESSAGLKAKARSYVLQHADGIIVYSSAVKEWYRNHFARLRIDICPNIQNPDTLLSYRASFDSYHHEYLRKYNLKECNIILYTGRLVEVKGLDLLLNAFAKAKISNYKLVLVGDGNQREELQIQVKSLGIEDKVVFAGYYSGNALYAWYDLANFFILPSRYEPFGAVVNEALVYGCPVVASQFIGALDFMNADNGLIFNPTNHQEFVSVLEKACKIYNGQRESKRINLMPCSFSDYVIAFKNINS